MKNREKDTYEDIINLPHPVSKKHPQMALTDRAAQFAPFAALTGHKEAIRHLQEEMSASEEEGGHLFSK